MATAEPIAVIGLACRFPGARTPDEFWSLLQRGGSAIGPVPPSRWSWSERAGFPPQPQPRHFQRGGFVEDLEYFDADFFGLSAAEAARLDPQQKLALEVSWQALECACLPPATLAGSYTGVVMGVGHGEHALKLKNDRASYDGKLGPNGYDCFVAHRVSYFLNLKGPSYSVNSACASSLQAVHLACQSLRSGECELMLAGGVNLHLAVDETVSCAMAGWLAADNRCKSFSEGGDGYVRGEGCGVVVLKRLADAQRDGDLVWGLLAGSALGHSGLTSGISWPSGNGQREVLRRALQHSGLAPGQIDALEAHGSGGAMSDRIEASAFTDVLGAGREPGQPLRVGCCKPNIGHLEAAAGIAGLIKILLCLREGELPAIAGLEQPNAAIPPSEAVRLLTAPVPWPRSAQRMRRAALSNFSFGGSNAALIVEEAPATSAMPASPAQGPLVLALRARSAGGLEHLQRSLRRGLGAAGQGLSHDLVHTLNLHRSEFKQRVAYLGGDLAQLDAGFQLDAPGQRVATADFPPTLRGARPVLVLGPQTLGSAWADPAAELRRWFVTAGVLDAWQADGGGFVAGAREGVDQAPGVAAFWAYFFHRLGVGSRSVVVMPGLALAAPLAGAETLLPGPLDGDLRSLALPPTPLFFGPQAAGGVHCGELPVLAMSSAGEPGGLPGDWRPGLARLLMGLYCLGSPLQWAWFASGRKTARVTSPFDRAHSWFEAAGSAAPARSSASASPAATATAFSV
ncbi:MAG TPA: beta-ketoacyl synthase N-terminal-like domain-containing protein [Ideonella sp.]|nr:beta-ketoacyl synthase N-terminal-like domain-containing protein [Ideonella sp.]